VLVEVDGLSSGQRKTLDAIMAVVAEDLGCYQLYDEHIERSKVSHEIAALALPASRFSCMLRIPIAA
jgi:hypothetical protein